MWYWYIGGFFALFVLLDAMARKSGLGRGLLWVAGTAIAAPVVLPFYFACRPLKPGEVREGGRGWNVLKNFAIVWTILILLGAMAGLYDSGQQLQRPMSEAEKFGSGLGIIAGLGLWGALWFFPVLGALVLGLLLKKSSIVERGPG